MANDKLSAASARSVICVLRSLDVRAAITGERLSVGLLPSQMSLRSASLARPTAQRELSAVRFLLRELESEDFGDHIEKVFTEFPWIRKSKLSEVKRARLSSERTLGDLRDDMGRVMRSIREGGEAIDTGDLDDEELSRRISGVRNERPDKVVNKENASLLRRDYLRIIMDLSEHDAESDVAEYLKGGAIRPGVAKAVIGALYLFGMRPVELWNSLVYIPRTDMEIPREAAEMIVSAPMRSIEGKHMTDSFSEAERVGEKQGVCIVRSARITGAVPILAIGTAKTTNANPDLKVPVRAMSLGGIDLRDASILAAACMMRFGDNSERERNRVRSATISILRTIASKWPDMRQDLTLYTFRHSFVTRARFSLEDAESAALTGHTSPFTLGGYGESDWKRKKKSGGWMPKADPERAKIIREVWDAKLADPEMKNDLMTSLGSDTDDLDEDLNHEQDLPQEGKR